MRKERCIKMLIRKGYSPIVVLKKETAKKVLDAPKRKLNFNVSAFQEDIRKQLQEVRK